MWLCYLCCHIPINSNFCFHFNYCFEFFKRKCVNVSYLDFSQCNYMWTVSIWCVNMLCLLILLRDNVNWILLHAKIVPANVSIELLHTMQCVLFIWMCLLNFCIKFHVCIVICVMCNWFLFKFLMICVHVNIFWTYHVKFLKWFQRNLCVMCNV